MARNLLIVTFALLAVVSGTCGVALAGTRAPKDHGKGPSPTPAAASAVKSPTPAPVAEAKPTPVPINQNAQVIVLGYHRLVSKEKRPDTEISATDFEAQMQQLKEKGISVIPLQQVLAWERGEKDIPSESAVLTFDDGWKSQYEVAWPILKKYGYPFTLFIYTDYVRGGPKSGGESLTWEQLAEMRDAGVDIQGHTVSHHDLTKKIKTPQFPEYDAWLWNELNGSKQMLEQRLGINVNTLALPYGRYNAHVQEVAKKAGYAAVFTVYGQKIGRSSPPSALGRYMIEANKPQVFASAVRFDHRGIESPSAVAEFTAESVPTQPADGATISDPRPIIQAHLENFGSLVPKTLSMRISGFGKVDAKFDPASKTLSYQPSRKLGATSYTVIVSGESQGKRQQVKWSFSVAPEAVGASASPSPSRAVPAKASSAR